MLYMNEFHLDLCLPTKTMFDKAYLIFFLVSETKIAVCGYGYIGSIT